MAGRCEDCPLLIFAKVFVVARLAGVLAHRENAANFGARHDGGIGDANYSDAD
jgi:hypothetical protein